ncbi:TlpA family protein disulfide reductase [Baekduia soli]|uniref:TlpA family protein disulfide reductase n=1 Tax=Baekduia soli TaxID=496014 RepID=A0A5B8U0Z9_9ACTN|nr:TlpA disulfide reductase family protein [Baekduia soli]QEC46699.1 TlpA family protein disulfide reductase [Baekduia soli]
MSRRLLLVLGAVVAVIAMVVIGLSQAGSKSKTPAPATLSLAQQRERLAGAPAPLAGLHAQASELLTGGTTAVGARMAALQRAGYPVVINKWAAWCGPCRLEFPVFQRVSVALGKRVAFIGLDGHDNRGDARAFLARTPLSYPSYEDPNERTAHSLQAGAFYPTTVFVDARGRRTVHQGPYNDEATLERDIRRYALGRA